MFRLLFLFVLSLAVSSQAFAAVKWNNSSPLKTTGKHLPKHWLFAVDFSDPKQLKQFDLERFQSCNLRQCKDGFTPSEIITEENGNKFLSISARHGQLGNLGKGNSYRNELGTRPDYNDFHLNGLTHWYGFRVKKPSQNEGASFDNTFTQIKQVTKIKKGKEKQNCSKGVVFHMNEGGFAFNGDGLNYPKQKFIPNITQEKWSTYKIGIKYSYNNDGWIRLYRNNEIVWEDYGQNLITRFYDECNSDDIDLVSNHLRIGVYAKSTNLNAVNTLHFDDFVSSHKESDLDEFLSSTANNPDGSSKQTLVDEENTLKAAEDIKARIIIAKKNMRTNADFRECLISEGLDKTAINTMRFRPVSQEALAMFEVAANSECIKSINQ